jgi:hypothetical protein
MRVYERLVKDAMLDELKFCPNSTITRLVESMYIYFDGGELEEKDDDDLMMWAADVIDDFHSLSKLEDSLKRESAADRYK